MEMSFEKFDPESLLPESVRPEIYGLVIQNNPNLIDSAQDRLRRYIDDFAPEQVYEEVQRPSKVSLVVLSMIGAGFISASFQVDGLPAKLIFGGIGVMNANAFVTHALTRYKTRNVEPELSNEAKRYMYLKFFEKQKL